MPGERVRWAVVGATGLVGREALAILAERGVLAADVRAIASERSAGALVPYAGGALETESLEGASFEGVDVALFCASAEAAHRHARRAVSEGALVVDNSSAFRMDEGVPLVVPGVNGALLDAGPWLVANPNCSTIILLTALEPLRRRFGVVGVTVSTYQAVSGAGLGGLEELRAQTRAVARGEEPEARFFGEVCAGNVFSHDSAVEEWSGVNGEERKIIEESRKIWDDPFLRVTPTCVRVSVERAHAQSIVVELEEAASEAEVRAALAQGEGLEIVDDRAGNRFPTPRMASGQDGVYVGRIRPDPGLAGRPRARVRRWCLFVSADQLRRGAALSAVEIGERVVGRGRCVVS